MSDNEFNSTFPSCKGKTAFEAAAEIVEYYKDWIDWGNPKETIKKPICCAISLMRAYNFDLLIPDVFEYLLAYFGTTDATDDCINFYKEFNDIRVHTIKNLSKFIMAPQLEREAIKRGRTRYYDAQFALCIVDFLLVHRPCCRLVQTAWLIPAIAAGIPAMPLVAYAAEQLADFANDPVEALRFDCTGVGNSWLHRLGIYLLHQCHVHLVPPDPRLIRLMSLVSLPPSASVKSGKATRYSDYLAYAETPHYLHEAPPGQALGTALALELLGEFDPNRQGEHFRRIERAAAFYGYAILNGPKPSIKSIQKASGLSWADANKLVQRPFFSRLSFEYQCRYLLVEPCPECEVVGRNLKEKADETGESVLSSVSSW